MFNVCDLFFQFVQSFFRKATAQMVELIALPRCQARADARKAKDFTKADAIRDELTGTAGHSWPQLATAGHSWPQPATTGFSSIFQERSKKSAKAFETLQDT